MTNISYKKFTDSALEWVFKLSGRHINPKTVMCNFEEALINAVQSIFPYTKINGCLFHCKQAIRKKFVSLKFKNEKEIVEICMHKNSMDIPTVIPENKIEMKGDLFVNDNLKDAVLDNEDIKNGYLLEIFYKIVDAIQ